VPHDAQAKELGTGKSRLEVLESLGLKNLQLAPLHRLEDGINAVRVFLPKCWFDAEKCARGIDALKLYHAEYDDKLQALRPRPVHDRRRCVPLPGAHARSQGDALRLLSPHRLSAARRGVIGWGTADISQRLAAAKSVETEPERS
jgi:hypothetical protein